MRKLSILGILGLASVLSPGLDLMAYTFEAHPGLYTSYEYTDNYLGSVRDAKSDSIYYVGPSLGLLCASPDTNIDFTGSYAKDFHQRFSEDDSPEINLASHASFTMQRQTIQMAYGYVQTWTREFLTEPFGENKSNTGSIGYTAALTQKTSMNAGCNIVTETWSVPHEEAPTSANQDEKTISGNVGIIHQLTPQDTISLTARQDRYNYQISPDVVGTSCGLHVSHAISPSFSLNSEIVYNHYKGVTLGDIVNQGGQPGDEDRYDADLSGQYALDQSTTVIVKGGYSWLEGQDHETAYLANASLEKVVDKNRFSLQVSKQLSAQFNIGLNLNGNYDSTTASLLWERHWLEKLSTTISMSLDNERPIGSTQGENETISGTHLTLTWEPIKYLAANLMYEHLQTKYEISGTARENRYSTMVKVQY
ncbi:MAG: hypothetical protein ACLQDF_15795 [Desulfomonilia bacterium]